MQRKVPLFLILCSVTIITSQIVILMGHGLGGG